MTTLIRCACLCIWCTMLTLLWTNCIQYCHLAEWPLVVPQSQHAMKLACHSEYKNAEELPPPTSFYNAKICFAGLWKLGLRSKYDHWEQHLGLLLAYEGTSIKASKLNTPILIYMSLPTTFQAHEKEIWKWLYQNSLEYFSIQSLKVLRMTWSN
jgi:hypothetical protein